MCVWIVADSFTEFQMYVVFEFEDSGSDLESFEVSHHCCSVPAALLFFTVVIRAATDCCYLRVKY